MIVLCDIGDLPFPVPSSMIAVKVLEPILNPLKVIRDGVSWYGKKADLFENKKKRLITSRKKIYT